MVEITVGHQTLSDQNARLILQHVQQSHIMFEHLIDLALVLSCKSQIQQLSSVDNDDDTNEYV